MQGSLWTTLICATLGMLALAYAMVGFASGVPGEDRRFRARVPAFLRPVWPLARACGHYADRALSAAQRVAIARRLRRAEFADALTPADWAGGQLAYALVTACIASVAASVAGLPVAFAAAIGASMGLALPELRLRAATRSREAAILKELPSYLDVLTLAVEAGCSLQAAIGIATEKSADGSLRRALRRYLAEVRAGRSRADALHSLDEWVGLPAMTSLVGALLQAERTGASLGAVLRAQAAQRTDERFARAERLAAEAPVKMLGPLILCIFPCTFIVLGFPIVIRLLEAF